MKVTTMELDAQEAIDRRIAAGGRQVTPKQLLDEYELLGYCPDRALARLHSSRIQWGTMDGYRYPRIPIRLREADTWASPKSRHARRDARYHKMIGLRRTVFAVVRGVIFEAE